MKPKALLAAPVVLAAAVAGYWLTAGRFPRGCRVVVRLRNGSEIHGHVLADGLLATSVDSPSHGVRRLSWPFWRIEDVWDVSHDYQPVCLHGCVERP